MNKYPGLISSFRATKALKTVVIVSSFLIQNGDLRLQPTAG